MTVEMQAPNDVTPAAWTEVCQLRQLQPERATAALVGDPRVGMAQVAVVLLADGSLHCVGHYDPYCRANVIARGIVGSRTLGDEVVPTIASPMYKQVFDLRSGDALEDPTVSIGSWEIAVTDGIVEVGGVLRPPRFGDRRA